MKTKMFLFVALAIILLYPIVFVIFDVVLNDESLRLVQTSMICLSGLLFGWLGLKAWKCWLDHKVTLIQQQYTQDDRKELLAWFDKALLRSLTKAKTPKDSDEEALKKRLEALINMAKDELSNAKSLEGQQAAEKRLQKFIDQMEQLLIPKPTT